MTRPPSNAAMNPWRPVADLPGVTVMRIAARRDASTHFVAVDGELVGVIERVKGTRAIFTPWTAYRITDSGSWEKIASFYGETGRREALAAVAGEML